MWLLSQSNHVWRWLVLIPLQGILIWLQPVVVHLASDNPLTPAIQSHTHRLRLPSYRLLLFTFRFLSAALRKSWHFHYGHLVHSLLAPFFSDKTFHQSGVWILHSAHFSSNPDKNLCMNHRAGWSSGLFLNGVLYTHTQIPQQIHHHDKFVYFTLNVWWLFLSWLTCCRQQFPLTVSQNNKPCNCL